MLDYPYLDSIDTPEDLRRLDKNVLEKVCEDLRYYIIDNVSKNGGHFAASLGVVELTVALHYVFNTPYDLLVWDVGHQAYGHKILTERKKKFHTNRKYKGISGFPKMAESKYDTFGVGHSSTSISAALGMSIASNYKKEQDKKIIAIIGDGAMTAGIAFEALNHAGVVKDDLLIILNDNCMGIDPNVGALNKYLTKITTSVLYNKIKDDIWHIVDKLPIGKQVLIDATVSLESSIKGFVNKQSNLFEALGIRYFGAVDGHNVLKLVETLNDLKQIRGVKILHVLTVKGKGYKFAEEDKIKWHAPGLFNKITGEILATSSKISPPKYQNVFGITIIELAQANNKVFGITPAMPSGSSLNMMIKQMPDRAFDVGICEQHAVTLSAGMATQGLKVFCNIYSSFMQRAYDQIIHDVAIQKLPVIFCLDRAGLVGEDGATHHGAYDLAYMRCIPNMIVAAPMNEIELRNLMFTAQLEKMQNPISIRYPRGEGVLIEWQKPFEEIIIGQGRIIQQGKKIVILSIGHIGNTIVTVNEKLKKENIILSHYDLRFIKPLDDKLLHQAFDNHELIVTVEDGCIQGGLGSAIAEWMLHHNYLKPIKMIGIPDKVIEHGSVKELFIECGMDEDSVFTKIKNWYV